MNSPLRIIISGGGTGGHIFPAISIANAIKALRPDTEFLFVGAEGRMEMQRVPQAGYPIKGLPVMGFDRKHLLANIKVLAKLWQSRQMAKDIVKTFRPDCAVGVGGYASGPTLHVAANLGVPTLLQEQNSYAGVTNKLLAKRAKAICVAYEGMERFFPADRITLTGNPVRRELLEQLRPRTEVLTDWGFATNKPTVLLIGGSLGAQTMNESVLNHLPLLRQSDVQFIWQTGKVYASQIATRLAAEGGKPDNLCVVDFISDMGSAYAAADLVISRAGAGSISELCLLGKPTILVPSPNVSEDHQTKNARALSDNGAALFVADADAPRTLLPLAINTVRQPDKLTQLSTAIRLLAKPNAAEVIAQKVIALAEAYRNGHA
ncbi:MAG: undecaprenyldiphospho-muramoylpentapeptide beta-N-acetylglucosaminyltransferase [Bacteroidales bacterium]|nr:undecaprenyldiphospho-muramoylpentapeptide beta-N-acetylglucosaminyltransferase [Bacteroidales bacterium]